VAAAPAVSATRRSEGGRMINRQATLLALVIAAVLIVSACASSPSTSTTLVPPLSSSSAAAADKIPPTPPLDPDRVKEGEVIYGQYCASCHRADLSGDPDWKTRNADGSLRPPPHDNTGHTWHHSDALLLSLTRDDSVFPESRMPSFGGTLTDDEIIAVFEFIKASWGPQERDIQWRVTWSEENREQG
jgi:mono/diheme cytochrome c family protein